MVDSEKSMRNTYRDEKDALQDMKSEDVKANYEIAKENKDFKNSLVQGLTPEQYDTYASLANNSGNKLDTGVANIDRPTDVHEQASQLQDEHFEKRGAEALKKAEQLADENAQSSVEGSTWHTGKE